MKIAVIGSRNLTNIDLSQYIPKDITEIISGGAKGVDTAAREYALSHNIKLTEILPDYKRYGRGAPLKRNIDIIERADKVIAFWNGISHGTKFVMENCQKRNIPIDIIKLS